MSKPSYIPPEISLLEQVSEQGAAFPWKIHNDISLGIPAVNFTPHEFHKLLRKLYKDGYLEISSVRPFYASQKSLRTYSRTSKGTQLVKEFYK